LGVAFGDALAVPAENSSTGVGLAAEAEVAAAVVVEAYSPSGGDVSADMVGLAVGSDGATAASVGGAGDGVVREVEGAGAVAGTTRSSLLPPRPLLSPVPSFFFWLLPAPAAAREVESRMDAAVATESTPRFRANGGGAGIDRSGKRVNIVAAAIDDALAFSHGPPLVPQMLGTAVAEREEPVARTCTHDMDASTAAESQRRMARTTAFGESESSTSVAPCSATIGYKTASGVAVGTLPVSGFAVAAAVKRPEGHGRRTGRGAAAAAMAKAVVAGSADDPLCDGEPGRTPRTAAAACDTAELSGAM
jgi:hypothetical protein